jgi:hypothetical protein
MLPTIHTNLVMRYIANNDDLFPKRETKSFYDFGGTADEEWLVDEIIAHRRINSKELEISGPLDPRRRDMGTRVSM